MSGRLSQSMPPPDSDTSEIPAGTPQKKAKTSNHNEQNGYTIVKTGRTGSRNRPEPVRRSDLIWTDLNMSPTDFQMKMLEQCRILSLLAQQAQIRVNRWVKIC